MLMRNEIKGAIEAVLFVSSEAMSIDELVELLEVPLLELRPIMAELIEEYKRSSRGIQIIVKEEGYIMGSAPAYTDILTRLTKSVRRGFSQAALESLALIAYRQPITKMEIEKARGIKSDKIINTLLEQGLIMPMGNKPVLGKPLMYGTTAEFLRVFGLTGLNELPLWQEDSNGG